MGRVNFRLRAIDSDIEQGIKQEMLSHGLDKSDAVRSLVRLGIIARKGNKPLQIKDEEQGNIELIKKDKNADELVTDLDNLINSF
ncbi:hypothetical protein [Evansella tamaricis]|uniref:Ribbon-helix-helix protein CopG domain-containing protein n=1 Tax=Evansella tamaricis TaxID=2069301 RepID=A0ABS6JL49_9BACI|nr:hypothetical protein [Evansella tamaricis]MBU9714406.1 hypothetical protein [Evansella tamaricis]